MAKRDYYEVLGIDRNADEATIKKAYRSLAMQHHPDKNHNDDQAVEKMKQINEAHAVLCDPQKRSLYDRYGHAGLEGYAPEDIFRGVDFGSLFRESGLGGFGDSIFDSLFGGSTATGRGARRGADLRYDLIVTLEEVASGVEKTVELPKAEKCSACNGTGAQPDGLVDCRKCRGTGQVVREQRSGYGIIRQITVCGDCRGKGKIVKKACKECQGKGIIEQTKEIRVIVPAGADTGHQIRIEGEGGIGEGVPGDLYIVFNVEKHPVFERHGDDIYLQQDISFTTAALGGQVQVPGLDGDLDIDITEGAQTGTIFRITGKGIPHLDHRGRGDEYVVVRVITPTKLSREEKELLRGFERLRQKSGSDRHGDGKKG